MNSEQKKQEKIIPLGSIATRGAVSRLFVQAVLGVKLEGTVPAVRAIVHAFVVDRMFGMTYYHTGGGQWL